MRPSVLATVMLLSAPVIGSGAPPEVTRWKFICETAGEGTFTRLKDGKTVSGRTRLFGKSTFQGFTPSSANPNEGTVTMILSGDQQTPSAVQVRYEVGANGSVGLFENSDQQVIRTIFIGQKPVNHGSRFFYAVSRHVAMEPKFIVAEQFTGWCEVR